MPTENSITLTCGQCGTLFGTNDRRRRFCSRECAYRSHEGSGNPIAVPRIERCCRICGAAFLTTQDRINKGGGIYCSVACRGIAQRKTPDTIALVDRICSYCGKAFRAKAGQVNAGFAKYCTRSCYGAAKAMLVGPDAAGWKGGSTPERVLDRHRVAYKTWQKAVYMRDDYTCQDCGKRGGVIHAHHLKSYAEHPALRHEVSNGVTLCRTCHYARHRK